jgi:hypothetical protein
MIEGIKSALHNGPVTTVPPHPQQEASVNIDMNHLTEEAT